MRLAKGLTPSPPLVRARRPIILYNNNIDMQLYLRVNHRLMRKLVIILNISPFILTHSYFTNLVKTFVSYMSLSFYHLRPPYLNLQNLMILHQEYSIYGKMAKSV